MDLMSDATDAPAHPDRHTFLTLLTGVGNVYQVATLAFLHQVLKVAVQDAYGSEGLSAWQRRIQVLLDEEIRNVHPHTYRRVKLVE